MVADAVGTHDAGKSTNAAYAAHGISGKPYSMVFFAQKALRKVAGNWMFVVATDRVELDDQIAKTFKACAR